MKSRTLLVLLAAASILSVAGCGKAVDSAAKSAADSTVKNAGSSATIFASLGTKLEATCGKNAHGLSQSDCVSRIRERKAQCAEQLGQKYPGSLDSYDRLKEATQTFSDCIFTG